MHVGPTPPEDEGTLYVRRVPLPWRTDPGLTECGLTAEGRRAVTVEEFQETAKRLGRQRFAMTSCMTCISRTHRYDDGADDMLDAISREIERVRWGGPKRDPGARARLVSEFQAIMMLVEAHRGEFDAAVSALGDTTDLAKRRAERARRIR